jgi:hypothetical protein
MNSQLGSNSPESHNAWDKKGVAPQTFELYANEPLIAFLQRIIHFSVRILAV